MLFVLDCKSLSLSTCSESFSGGLELAKGELNPCVLKSWLFCKSAKYVS